MTDTLEQKARRLVSDQAYEYASEEGYIHWMPSTRIDPGCWSDDLDIEFELTVGGDDDMTGTSKVFLGKSLLFEQEHRFWIGRGGYLYFESEDV